MERIILSPAAVRVAAELASCMPGFQIGEPAMVSYWQLSLLTGLAERTCYKALVELTDSGAITNTKAGQRRVVTIVPSSWVWTAVAQVRS